MSIKLDTDARDMTEKIVLLLYARELLTKKQMCVYLKCDFNQIS